MKRSAIVSLICVYAAAPVEPLLESDNLSVTPSDLPQAIQPHWTALARSLTDLRLKIRLDIGQATPSALHELTRLQCLTLCGLRSTTGTLPRARIELSLPQLQVIAVGTFSHVSIALNCPQLEVLGLVDLHPLEAVQGIPQGIERVNLLYLGEGSLSPQESLRGHMLEGLTDLAIVARPQVYQDPEALEVAISHYRLPAGKAHTLAWA